MVSRVLCTAGLAALLATFAPGRAAACGGFFTEVNSADVATMSDIRVALVKDQGRVTQYVQVGYSGSATRFAWIYPVPSLPDVAEDTNDILAKLEQATRPRITIYTPHSSSGGGFACGADDAAGGPDGRDVSPPVQVWQTGQVGAFDYAVVSASAAQDLLDWLNQNGFAVPSSTSDVVGYYLSRGWMFVAMKVSVAAASAAGVPSTTTVKFSYDATEVRYPLKMVSLSPAASTSLELYLVTTTGGMELGAESPFVTLDIDAAKVVATAPDTANYDEVFTATRAQAGARGLVREFSGAPWAAVAGLPSYATITRLRTTFDADAMDQDITFVERQHTPVSAVYELHYDENAAAAAPPLLVLLLLLWRWRARRLRR